MNDNLYYIHAVASLNFLLMLLGYCVHGIVKSLPPAGGPQVKSVQRRGVRITK